MPSNSTNLFNVDLQGRIFFVERENNKPLFLQYTHGTMDMKIHRKCDDDDMRIHFAAVTTDLAFKLDHTNALRFDFTLLGNVEGANIGLPIFATTFSGTNLDNSTGIYTIMKLTFAPTKEYLSAHYLYQGGPFTFMSEPTNFIITST